MENKSPAQQSKDNVFDREIKRAAKMQQRRADREKRRQNSLPPFLIVRSGLWGSCLFPVFTGAAACVTPYQDGQNPRFYAWLVLTAMFAIVATTRTSSQIKKAKEDIKSVQYEMSEYVKDPEYILDLSQVRNFPRMTSILVRYITKHNPGVFDRFIENPKSITDNEAMQDIISAYLDKHADAAPKILNALEQIKLKPVKVQYGIVEDEPQPVENPDSILPVSYELRKRLERCARRAKMVGVCH